MKIVIIEGGPPTRVQWPSTLKHVPVDGGAAAAAAADIRYPATFPGNSRLPEIIDADFKTDKCCRWS